jgi:hemolysin III
LSTTLELFVIPSAATPVSAALAQVDPADAIPPAADDWAEELVNSATHGVGLVLSIAGLYTLVRMTGTGRVPHPQSALGCTIYGVSLVLLYAASTCYHGCRHAGRKRVLLVLDHIGIYLLIAGTYTPVALIVLHGRLGSALLTVVWTLALAGSLAKLGRIDRVSEDSPWSYVALGALVLASAGRLAVNVPAHAFQWLVAGGLFYLVGLAFFLRHDRRFNHAIWHLFVLAGSACHYRAVVGFVLPLCGADLS